MEIKIENMPTNSIIIKGEPVKTKISKEKSESKLEIEILDKKTNKRKILEIIAKNRDKAREVDLDILTKNIIRAFEKALEDKKNGKL